MRPSLQLQDNGVPVYVQIREQMLQAIVLQNVPVQQAVDEQVKRMEAAIAQMRR